MAIGFFVLLRQRFFFGRMRNAHRQVSRYGYLQLFRVSTLTTFGNLPVKLSVFAFFFVMCESQAGTASHRRKLGATIVPQPPFELSLSSINPKMVRPPQF